MSVVGGEAENMCSARVFRLLTQLGHSDIGDRHAPRPQPLSARQPPRRTTRNLDPSVRCQSVNSMLNRPTPVDLVANLTIFPESAANVPEANLKTVFPEFSKPTALPSFMIRDPVPCELRNRKSPGRSVDPAGIKKHSLGTIPLTDRGPRVHSSFQEAIHTEAGKLVARKAMPSPVAYGLLASGADKAAFIPPDRFCERKSTCAN